MTFTCDTACWYTTTAIAELALFFVLAGSLLAVFVIWWKS